jgi:hypothetical protein
MPAFSREKARSWLEGVKRTQTSLAQANVEMRPRAAEANGREQEELGLQADGAAKCSIDMDKGLKSEMERMERMAAE